MCFKCIKRTKKLEDKILSIISMLETKKKNANIVNQYLINMDIEMFKQELSELKKVRELQTAELN